MVCFFLVLRLLTAGYDAGEAAPVQPAEPAPPAIERSTVMFDAEGRQILLGHKSYLVTVDEDSWGTAVPAADLARYLGASVTANENGITISYGGKKLTLTAGKKQFGRDFAPFYSDGCLYAPMDALSDFFGLPMQVVDDFDWLVEDEPDYLVTHPRQHCIPSIVLGESKYTEDFFYKELYRLENDNVAMVERHVAATVPYSVGELKEIANRYVRWPLDEYVYYNYIDKQPVDNYFIPPELVATDGMQQLLLAMQRYHRELEGMVLAATGDADHLTLTIYMQLYSGFWDLPCLFDVDLTRQPESWLQKYNDEYRIADYKPEVYKPEIGAWQITAVSNVRGYLNAQALLDHEPELFE